MIISLNKLTRKEIDSLDINALFDMDFISHFGNEYKIKDQIKVDGKISNVSKGLYLKLKFDFVLIDNCSRCLIDVEVPTKYSIEGFLIKGNVDDVDFEDDVFLFDGQDLDLSDIINQTIDFEIPLSTLCDEECEGLCLTCGINLNDEVCSCNQSANNEDQIIDSRFAKLKDLIKND
ncbi:MAG: DUF177 domain-containing protein [Peptostreptococcaceae bacterium]